MTSGKVVAAALIVNKKMFWQAPLKPWHVPSSIWVHFGPCWPIVHCKIDSPIFFQPQHGRHSWLWLSDKQARPRRPPIKLFQYGFIRHTNSTLTLNLISLVFNLFIFHGSEPYRTPRVFGDTFCDKFGDQFGDSPYFVINLLTMLVTHFVSHPICHNFWWQCYHTFWLLTYFIT